MWDSSDYCTSTCEDYPEDIPSYGDIGGIGVTLAFVLTAWMVVLVLIGYYLKAFDPKLDPFRKEGTQKLSKYPNSVDYFVNNLLQKVLEAWRDIQQRIEVPPAEGGRPAICYFKQGVDVNSITFSSGVKMILLLLWGFSIRIAKMFERFEGGLRKFAYRMHHKSRILRYGVDDGSTTQIWDPRARRKGQGFFGHLLEPFKIAILVVLSIQLDFLTSFLAEVYWLLFTIIYITTRLVKFRIPSPADDNKWTFGQVLPLILLVAPIAIAIESFYTAPKTHTPQMAHTNTQQMNGPGSGLDPVAGLGHVDSLAYRGVFFLAALSYIEVGIYFVLDQPDTEGLALPLLQIALSILLRFGAGH
ncbi:hypothetical protein Forpi1262_v015857 [Fusarium oxysporum f. sp. raphani]|uniref:Uncharacterized protein n=1 Tax=Fusarium oxysporum f. sp. raphani TaxID=96318 RepID=A0A8J5PJG9_FUSOX|nr:hypothetical protein Forpi1262_v015857 [Fusarium oxysporum f. sp. raphani]